VVREYDTGVTLTQLALAPNSKVMFAGTDTGAVRCYKWPLSGEFTELKLHTGPISRMRLSGDESLLFTAGEDGAVCVLDVRWVARQLALVLLRAGDGD
jgi:WD40 repeat protein